MAKFTEHMDKIGEEIAGSYQKIEDGVMEGYQRIETGVVDGYKKIETGVVDGFTAMTDKLSGAMRKEDGTLKTGKAGDAVVGAYRKVEDAFVSKFLTREGESVEEAKARLAAEQKAREEAAKAEAEKRAADQKAVIEASLEKSRNAGKRDC